MSTDNPPAADTDRLAGLIIQEMPQHLPSAALEVCALEDWHAGAMSVAAQAVESGILRDADDQMVKEQQLANSSYWEGHEAGRAEGRAELQAAIETLIEPGVSPDGESLPEWVHVSELRALLADAEADALREVKADVWDECVRQVVAFAEHQTTRPFEVAEVTVGDLLAALRNPYRDTAGEAGDG